MGHIFSSQVERRPKQKYSKMKAKSLTNCLKKTKAIVIDKQMDLTLGTLNPSERKTLLVTVVSVSNKIAKQQSGDMNPSL